jgi:FkbM family methyltransferase
MDLKTTAHKLVNGVLLKPFGLELSFRIGHDPVDDMVRLLLGQTVSVIVDGGAHAGTFTQAISQAFPHAKVHAFEPTPSSFALLEENTRGLASVVVHRRALSSESGQATLFVCASPLTNSLRKSTTSGLRYFSELVADRGAIDVQTVKLADFAKTSTVKAIDILKLDLQGAELEAIIGLGSLIESVKLIHAEVQFVELYEGTPLFSDVESYLRKRGLIFYQLYGLVRSPKDGRLLYGDATFVRSTILPINGGSR